MISPMETDPPTGQRDSPRSALDAFLPPVRRWFESAFGEPTPPQVLGWPAIQRGEHTLILSPTGSGKTLAAFLVGINDIYTRLAAEAIHQGVELLYISPLKALNNDIERNLRVPLAGIRETSVAMGAPLPRLRVAVRTGDTPQAMRASMVRHPPHILITTPESLYLILTSPQARNILRTVRTLIVDEIHTLCGNKRGVHLALSLERLEHLADRPIQRIGLSATQRPLEEVARFLGGYIWAEGTGGHEKELVPRAVTIIDAGCEKALDLQVVTAVDDLRYAPGHSIWSSVIPQVLQMILQHNTTLIFANSRRQAERAADRLNAQYLAESEEEVPPGSTEVLSPGGVPRTIGFTGTGITDGPFRAHHGSISRTARFELEQALKEGRLPALVGTSSLELGIDIGSVDLVVQLQSPKGIARGLQRVGRSGHLVGQTSVGRIFPTHLEDLLEAAAVAHGMLTGDVEPTYTPQNCLDVLAQQVVAMVSVQDWDVDALYDLIRCAYPYGQLTPQLYRSVLDMLSGKYPSASFRELRPRLVWNRVDNRLAALPGSRLLALHNGGTIPDRGVFGVYLPDGTTKLGELDEEFVFETRPGDVFSLGSQVWRVVNVTADRVVVADGTGATPRMPFWRGDIPYRDYHLGLRLGHLRRALTEQIEPLPPLPELPDQPWPEAALQTLRWLQKEYVLDERSARNAMLYVQRQIASLGAISSDRAIILETFADALGDWRLVVHSCFGGRVNSAWALALANAFRERLGITPEMQVSDDGILFRFPEADSAPPLDIVTGMGFEETKERLLVELPNSALFGAQFRVNAARSLLLPRASGSRRRTPFWLQRLRAKDLLAVAKGFGDFPIVAETYRDCLREVLDLDHLEELLRGIERGEIRIVKAETVAPSPVAANLLFNFAAIHMYEWDAPKLERQIQALALDRHLLAQLLDEGELANLLRPEAVAQVEAELSRIAEGYQARTLEELASLIEEAGDLTTGELLARCPDQGQGWLDELVGQGRIMQIKLGSDQEVGPRWIATTAYGLYRDAFGLPQTPPLPVPAHLLAAQQTQDEARLSILRRFLRHHGPRQRSEILQRYPFPVKWLDEALAQLAEAGEIVSGRLTAAAETMFPAEEQICDRHVLQRIHQRTLLLLRKEVQPVSVAGYADFLLRWQHLYPEERFSGPDALQRAMAQLRGATAPGIVWLRDMLTLRVRDYREMDLEMLCASGEWFWVGLGGKDPKRSRIRLLPRGEGALFLEPQPEDLSELSAEARAVLAFLQQEGACFLADLQSGLGLDSQAIGVALIELVMAGLVTNDTIGALREIIMHPVSEEDRPPLSSLEAELDAWRRSRPQPRLTAERYRAAKHRVAKVVRDSPRWPGRWSLVHRFSAWGQDVSPEERAAQQARQLLARHGIATRASLDLEEGSWDWPNIYAQFTLMEMRGEIRRGYFVRGLPGIQFATPEALEQLRAWSGERQERGADPEQLVLMNACDPANLFGLGAKLPSALESARRLSSGRDMAADLDPARLPRLPGNYLVALRGKPILGVLNGGARIVALPDVGEEVLLQGVRLFLTHIAESGDLAPSPYRVLVEAWNGEPPIGGPGESLLTALGFRREAPNMVWDRGV